MAQTTYTFSIQLDVPVGAVAIDALVSEIAASSIVVALSHINRNGDELGIVFKAALSGTEQTTLASILAAHEGVEINTYPIVQINAESKPVTGGNYQSTTVLVECNPEDQFSIEEISWPFPISLIGGSYEVWGGEEEGDLFEVIAAPNTTVGVVIEEAVQGATTLKVNSTVFQYLERGFFVDLFDGQNSIEVGRCISLNKTAGTIQIETPLPSTISPMTQVRMSIKYCAHTTFGAAGRMDLGRTIRGASHVPAGTVIQFKFTNRNQNPSAKKVLVILEYYY